MSSKKPPPPEFISDDETTGFFRIPANQAPQPPQQAAAQPQTARQPQAKQRSSQKQQGPPNSDNRLPPPMPNTEIRNRSPKPKETSLPPASSPSQVAPQRPAAGKKNSSVSQSATSAPPNAPVRQKQRPRTLSANPRKNGQPGPGQLSYQELRRLLGIAVPILAIVILVGAGSILVLLYKQYHYKGMYEQQSEKFQAERSEMQEELDTLRGKYTKLQTEYDKIKRSPQHAFDQIILTYKDTSKDAKAQKAVDAYKVFLSRFPKSELAASARDKLKELQGQIDQRAKVRAKAHKEIRSLIKQCKLNATKAAKIEQNGVSFNRFNRLDMNRAMQANRKAQVFHKRASEIKEQLEVLVKKVDDPKGLLQSEVYRCDEP